MSWQTDHLRSVSKELIKLRMSRDGTIKNVYIKKELMALWPTDLEKNNIVEIDVTESPEHAWFAKMDMLAIGPLTND